MELRLTAPFQPAGDQPEAIAELVGGHRGELIEIDRATPLEVQYVVDINSAEWPELAQLPSVGPTLAQRIVDSRKSDGAYRTHEDLLRVEGIGPVTLARMKPYLLPVQSVRDVAQIEPAR